MAFTNELPTGTSPFSNTLFKDPEGKVWTGDEFSSEFYRFLDPADLPFVNIEDFGAVGDGATDNRSVWDVALAVAKNTEKPLFIPSGTFLIEYDGVTMDMTGCTGLIGPGELVFDTQDEDEPILEWKGEIDAVGTGSTTIGGRTATLNTGLSIHPGETVYLISAEAIPNLTYNYTKGQRLTVLTYNQSDGATVFVEQFFDAITSGYYYLNTVQPKVRIDGVTVRTASSTHRKGLQFTFCDVSIKDLSMSNTTRACVIVSQSKAHVTNMKATDFYRSGSTTSYGLQIAGLSYVEAFGLDLRGGRHAIQHGDVGEFTNAMAGGDGQQMFLSAISKIFGGQFHCDPASYAYAFDAHAGCRDITVVGATIRGGIVFGNTRSLVKDCIISPVETPSARLVMELGRDAVDPAAGYRGQYYFDGCIFEDGGTLFRLTGSPEVVSVTNSTIYGKSTGSRHNQFMYLTGANIGRLIFSDNVHIGASGQDIVYNFRVNQNTVFRNFDISYAGIELVPWANFGHLMISGIKSTNSPARGLIVLNNISTYTGDLTVSNSSFVGATEEGLYPYMVHGIVRLSNNFVKGCTGAGIRVRGDSSKIFISSTVSTGNAFGLQINPFNAVNTCNYSLVDLDIRGNSTAFQVTNSPTQLQKVAVLE